MTALKKICVFAIVAFLACYAAPAMATGYYYQLRVYHFKTNEQQQVTNAYLKDVFVPNVHKLGMKQVGVFNTLANDTADRRTYVLIPFANWKAIEAFEDKIDVADAANGKSEYINASYKTPPYSRMEVIVLSAFDKAVSPLLPNLSAPKSERVYELRSYEGPTEKYYKNKVKMFNDGDEVGLFKRLGFNAVFYAKVLAGSRMPNLMYMTTFNSMADRDEHWKAFGDDAYWKKLSGMAQYQNNVSKADIIFLRPTDYSDF
ncbi:NIPSNAP family containing protein [Mucilaginibacter pallidiroseus]|uniref:NIPSNAP family containing protein n=1 Tax=Mucilaginibacter pallidiroseus TaxID=2599295 RepID=A0A563UCD0_9SPHI|nr:NIPSNAP family protein [Mucilaginibacter pallidiroseus]TWR28980.1 NIPSNAP family containing protein [Mucilaginibacter pallidiroseus]